MFKTKTTMIQPPRTPNLRGGIVHGFHRIRRTDRTGLLLGEEVADTYFSGVRNISLS